MTDTFHVYRAFRLHAREVWQCSLPEPVATSLQETDFETLKYMFSEVPPFVFTKCAIPFLAHSLIKWWDESIDPQYQPIRNHILSIIEAYPSSYHHAATQEVGIGFGINDSHWLTWPTWKWNVVYENGRVTHDGLSETQLASRKKNRKGRPKGVPDYVWGKL